MTPQVSRFAHPVRQAERPVEEKLLPQNAGAERAVLGSMLIDAEAVAQVAELLRPEDFYIEAHRLIYQAALEVHGRGALPDLIMLTDEMERCGTLEEVGGASFVSSLANQVPTSTGVRWYAEIVRRTAVSRRAIEVAGRIAALAYDDPDPDVLLSACEQQFDRVRSDARACRRGSGFRFMSDEECEVMPPARGIVGNLLYEDSIAFLYAREGRWKTFLALDWCLCCATGQKWLGRDVVAGDVVYIAAEGARGIGKRIRAWKVHHGIRDTVRIHVLPVPVQLLEVGQVRELIASIREQVGKPLLVVIDTLARSMAGGDENNTKDINAVTDAAYAVKAAFACCVLVLHHSGKEEARGMRGSSALRSNVDTVLRISSGNESEATIKPGEPITLRCEKSKDGETFDDVTLTAQLVTWATNEGVTHSSLVIVQGTPAEKQRARTLRDAQQKALNALYGALTPLRATEWCAASDLADRTFYDARDFLMRQGYVAQTKSTKAYTVTEAGEKQVTAELRNDCARSAPAANNLTECTAEDVEAGESDEPEFMGTQRTAATAVPIGAAQYRSTPTSGHNGQIGQVGQVRQFGQVANLAKRVKQLNAQGIHGDEAVRRALAERGQLPGRPERGEPVWSA